MPEPSKSAPEQACALLEELNRTLESGSPQQRLRILRSVTDVFMAGSRTFTDEQVAVFDEILIRLATDLEQAARTRLSQKMAGLDRAPRRLVRSLAFDPAIEVAAPVLIRSCALSDADLVENARSMSQAHLLAIAQRVALSEGVTDALIARGEARVVRCVVRNRRARFSLPGCEKLVVRARRDRTLAAELARREDLPRQIYVKLLQSASAEVRARLEAKYPDLAAEIEVSVDELATRLQEEARNASQQHAQAARNLQTRLRLRPASDADVHAPARANDFAKTALALSHLGGFAPDLAERALVDSSTDMLLILAKAADCSWTTARAMLTMPEARRNLTDDDLAQCAEQYGRLQPDAARALVRFREQRLAQAAPAPGVGVKLAAGAMRLAS
jgi:hypothetical protein